MMERATPLTARIGVFAVGHGTYWEQFDGLYDTLMAGHRIFCAMAEHNGVEVVDFGMVDSSEAAFQIAERIRSANLDLLFCNMVTYATSSVFAPIIQGTTLPTVLVALQPKKALDYNRANTRMQLENDNICSVPEFTGVAVRLGRKIEDVIIGSLYGDTEAEQEITRWCGIAKVLHGLKGARFGLMGHVLESMYDMHTDPTAISAAFGVHVPLLEIDSLVEYYEKVPAQEVAFQVERIRQEFDLPDPQNDPVTRKLTQEDLYQAARSAAALDRFVAANRLSGLAYYYEGTEGSLQRQVATTLIVGNSFLNAQGIPMCGEFDLKTCLAMFLMDRLDIGGSFAEFHPLDFNEDFILIGHDGPHHLRIAEGKPVLRSLLKYHGKPGGGASVEFKIKEGPITMLGITQGANGSLKFVIGEGLSQKGPVPPTGNTNTRGSFPPSTKQFVKDWVLEGPTHHFALGIGHHGQTLQKIAGVLGIDAVFVGK